MGTFRRFMVQSLSRTFASMSRIRRLNTYTEKNIRKALLSVSKRGALLALVICVFLPDPSGVGFVVGMFSTDERFLLKVDFDSLKGRIWPKYFQNLCVRS